MKSEADFADILEQQLPAVWTSNPGAQSTGSLASLAKIVKKVEQYQKDPSRG